MVFENEINIYNPQAIANEFHTQATQIGVVQGKISAIISDSQIQELQDGTVNMYEKLVSAQMDIDGIHTQVSTLQQVDGQLESQISTIRQTAQSIDLEVSSVKNNYARKAQIIMAINNTTQESETQIKAEHISLAGKTINLTSDNIAINSTYFKVDKNGRITATAGTFSGQLQAATGTFKGALQAATGTFSGELVAATGTFSGSLQAASGSFNGDMLSYNNGKYIQVHEGQIVIGEYSGNTWTETGRILSDNRYLAVYARRQLDLDFNTACRIGYFDSNMNHVRTMVDIDPDRVSIYNGATAGSYGNAVAIPTGFYSDGSVSGWIPAKLIGGIIYTS